MAQLALHTAEYDRETRVGVRLGMAEDALDFAFANSATEHKWAGEFGTERLAESVEPGVHGGASTDREARPLNSEPTNEMVQAGLNAEIEPGVKASVDIGVGVMRIVLRAALTVQQKGEG